MLRISLQAIEIFGEKLSDKYGASLNENSLFVKENGLAEFMEQQKQRYTCPECNGIISLHDLECSECGKRSEFGKNESIGDEDDRKAN